MAQVIVPKEHTKTHSETVVERPRLYKVLLLNDNYTTMEFVVMVLMSVFGKDEENATRIMLSVHRKGMGVAGVYVKDIAEMKCTTVHELAKSHGYPLRCDIEPE